MYMRQANAYEHWSQGRATFNAMVFLQVFIGFKNTTFGRWWNHRAPFPNWEQSVKKGHLLTSVSPTSRWAAFGCLSVSQKDVYRKYHFIKIMYILIHFNERVDKSSIHGWAQTPNRKYCFCSMLDLGEVSLGATNLCLGSGYMVWRHFSSFHTFSILQL